VPGGSVLVLQAVTCYTPHQANEFLTTFIEEFNAQFALTTNHSNSVFEAQPSNEQINLILAVITHRVVDKGHSIKFNKKFYFPVKDDGSSVYYRKGTSCLVIQAFDGNLYAVINDSVHGTKSLNTNPHPRILTCPSPLQSPRNATSLRCLTRGKHKSSANTWRPNPIGRYQRG
jgi:hypothetical protein